MKSLRIVGTLLLISVLSCDKQNAESSAMAQPVAVAKPIQNTGLYQKPHVTLVAVTDWQAVLKPCGCTVDLQKGGVERIGKFVADLRTSDNSVLVVHAGNLLADDEPLSATRAQQASLRMQAFVAALNRIQIAAVALSSLDLEQGGPVAKRFWHRCIGRC